MTTNILKQTLMENSNGVEKGSSKRVIAYLFAFVICFVAIYSVIKDPKNIPLELIGILITNLLILLGIGAYSAQANPPAPTGTATKTSTISTPSIVSTVEEVVKTV